MADLIFEPGFYTKIRLDDTGNIVDAGDLEAIDLPPHTHKVSDLKGDLTEVLYEIISKLFVDTADTAVKFSFDKNTKTISADVEIDDDTIIKNEFGELVSTGSGESVPSTSGSTASFEDLTAEFETFQKTIKEELLSEISRIFTNAQDSSVEFSWDDNTKTFSANVKIDELTVTKNEFGELQSGAGTDGVGTECGTHEHTSDQIRDFRDAVVNIFNDYSKTLNIDLQNLIDGTTIKINNEGQLTAVRTALEKHTHTLSEIVDYVAPDPAAKQPMSDLGEDVNYASGVIDFSKLNIGYSILALSEYLKKVTNKNIENLSKRIDEINISNDSHGSILLTIDENSIKNILYDKLTDFYQDVYYAPSVELILDYLSYLQGEIFLLINGEEVSKANIEDLSNKGDSSEVFSVDRVYFKGDFLARVLRIDPTSFLKKEGLYEVQLKFQTTNGKKDYSNRLKFYVSPNDALEYSIEDVTPSHFVGEKLFYNYREPRKYKVAIKNYSNYRFINTSGRFKEGEFIETAPGDFTLELENLFGETSIDVKFPLEEEKSESILYKWLKEIRGGSVVNDIIVPEGEYTCIFEIPCSQDFNSLKIEGIESRFCEISKGLRLKASGDAFAQFPDICGRVPVDANYSLLSFLNSYDDGKNNIQFIIKGTESIDLNNISVEKTNF